MLTNCCSLRAFRRAGGRGMAQLRRGKQSADTQGQGSPSPTPNRHIRIPSVPHQFAPASRSRRRHRSSSTPHATVLRLQCRRLHIVQRKETRQFGWGKAYNRAGAEQNGIQTLHGARGGAVREGRGSVGEGGAGAGR